VHDANGKNASGQCRAGCHHPSHRAPSPQNEFAVQRAYDGFWSEEKPPPEVVEMDREPDRHRLGRGNLHQHPDPHGDIVLHDAVFARNEHWMIPAVDHGLAASTMLNGVRATQAT
jgi:hypothetical protein